MKKIYLAPIQWTLITLNGSFYDILISFLLKNVHSGHAGDRIC